MFIEQIDIVGFRGINRLTLTLDQSTLLIGENAWGKSSLLDALTLLLNSANPLYQFTENDFYLADDRDIEQINLLRVLFTFKELQPGQSQMPRFQNLSRVWTQQSDNAYRIYYQIEGSRNKQGLVATQRTFLNEQGDKLSLTDINELVKEVIRLSPVLRLSEIELTERSASDKFNQMLPVYLQELAQRLTDSVKGFAKSDLNGSVQAMRALLENYLSGHKNSGIRDSAKPVNLVDWRSLESLNRAIDEPKNQETKTVLLTIFAGLLQVKNSNHIDPDAHPLLLVEEPESRLHPIMMSVAWGLLNHLPLQKITTTNSGELLSLVPIEQVCRLVRESDQIVAYRLDKQRLSNEERRRIAFHIRFNRPSSFFSRCWLLVEGETEVWLLNELARQCDYHFETEGIKIIEFAQCGIKPLIKFADQMGIEWHVLVDGDGAGKKYAEITRSLIYNDSNRHSHDAHQQKNSREYQQDRLTVLPALDLEHFMYHSGFDSVYWRVASIDQVNMSVRRIIHKAIQRSSKPDLAIEVADQAEKWGINSVPPLLRTLFSKVLWLARGRAE